MRSLSTKLYDGQVIIGLVKNNILVLKKRWEDHHPGKPCIIVEGREFLSGQSEKCSNFFKSTDFIRLYVWVHARPKADFINEFDKTSIPVNTLAHLLANFIGDQEVVVNLVSCGAARGDDDLPFKNLAESAAVKLYLSLVEITGKDFLVVARTQLMAVAEEHLSFSFRIDKERGAKVTRNIHLSFNLKSTNIPEKDRYIRKQSGSKIIIFDFPDTKFIDGGLNSWKRKVFKVLNKRINATEDQKKKQLLNSWLDKFEQYLPEEICNFLKENSASEIIKAHQSLLGLGETTTYKAIQELITEGENILKAPDTVTESRLISSA